MSDRRQLRRLNGPDGLEGRPLAGVIRTMERMLDQLNERGFLAENYAMAGGAALGGPVLGGAAFMALGAPAGLSLLGSFIIGAGVMSAIDIWVHRGPRAENLRSKDKFTLENMTLLGGAGAMVGQGLAKGGLSASRFVLRVKAATLRRLVGAPPRPPQTPLPPS